MRLVAPEYRIEAFYPEEDILQHLELFGRVCYKSEDKITPGSATRFVEMLVKRGHWSVIEHAGASVRFISNRGFSHELVRHRLTSPSQESTRYCDYSPAKAGKLSCDAGEVLQRQTEPPPEPQQDILFIRPIYWPETDPRWARLVQHFAASEQCYRELRAMGAKPEEARDCLPIGVKTEIILTCNLREWAHVFSLRAAKPAHPMMRTLMLPLLDEFATRLPPIFEPLAKSLCPDRLW